MIIIKKSQHKPYLKSYELYHKLHILNIENIKNSIQNIEDVQLRNNLNEMVKSLQNILIHNDKIKEIETNLHKLKEEQTNELIALQTFLENTQLTDLFKKSLTQNLTIWSFNPLDNVKSFYRAIYSYFSDPKIYRMLNQKLTELLKQFQITSEKGILQLLIDDKIISIEKKYDCPHCDNELSFENEEYQCMNCTYSESKENVESQCFCENEIYRGNNFDKIKELIG